MDAIGQQLIGQLPWGHNIQIMVEYALRGMDTPVGVSTFRTALPESVLSALPSIETLSEKLKFLPMDDGEIDEEDKNTKAD